MTDAEFTYQLIAVGSLLGNAVLLWRALRGGSEKREITPDPLNVRKAERFVTEDEHQALVDRVDRHDKEFRDIRGKMESNYNALMKSEAEGRSRLHHEINEVNKQLAGIAAVVEGLKGLPERISRDVGMLFGQLQNREK